VLAPLLEDLLGVSDPDEVCDLMRGFGVECGACSADGEPYCIDIEIQDITAQGYTGALEEITSADVDDNPDCQ
jgi:hypothetical protein